jgi:hypothetical protein
MEIRMKEEKNHIQTNLILAAYPYMIHIWNRIRIDLESLNILIFQRLEQQMN